MKWMNAKFAGRCALCPEPVIRGDRVGLMRGRVVCRACTRAAEARAAIAAEYRRDAVRHAALDSRHT